MKHSKENLESAINQSLTWYNVCNILGVKPRTGSQTHIKRKAVEFGLDFSHFTGQAWSKGKQSFNRKDALELCKENTRVSSHRLKLMLIRDGHKDDKCEICELTHWRGEPIVLELDHINSNHTDNRIENLQILCSNCHAQMTRNRRK